MKPSASNLEQIAQKAKRSLPHLEYDDILQEAHLLNLTNKTKVTTQRLVARLSEKVQCEVDSDRVTEFIDSRYSYPNAEDFIYSLQIWTLLYEVENLRQYQRDYLVLRYLNNQSIKEIEYCLNISRERVRQRIDKALKILKKYWGDSIKIRVNSDGSLIYKSEAVCSRREVDLPKGRGEPKSHVEPIFSPVKTKAEEEYKRSLSTSFTLIAAGIEESTLDALLSWIRHPTNWQYLVAQKSVTINDRVIPCQQYTVTINLNSATIVIVQLHSGLVNNGNRTCSTSNG